MKEKRNDTRYNISLDIKIIGINETFKARVSNLSVKGIFIETTKKFPSNSFLDMVIDIVPFDKKIEVLGKVIHSVKNRGVGVQFIDYFKDSKNTINKFVEFISYYNNRN